MRVFMPGATEWLCHYCKATFWWHPGASRLKAPSSCGCGEIQDPRLLEQLGGEQAEQQDG